MDETLILETVAETSAETTAQNLSADLVAVAGVRSSAALFPPSVSVNGSLYIPASAGVSSDIIQIARDCVAGYSGDYVLFSYSDSETVLVLSDSMIFENGTFSADTFTAYDIVSENQYQSVVRSVSGRLVSVGTNPEISDFTGSVDDERVLDTVYTLYYDSFDSAISISNSNHAVVYSSFDGFAHLQDTSSYFLYYISFILSLFGVSCLIWSIFKKVK